MKVKRLQFANTHQHCTAQQWRTVLFSNKLTFQQFVIGKQHIRRPTRKHFYDKFTISTIKLLQVRWFGWLRSKTGSLLLVSRNHYEWAKIRAYALREAETSHARSPMSNIYAGWRPCHHFNVAKNFLDDKNIEFLEWPGTVHRRSQDFWLWGSKPKITCNDVIRNFRRGIFCGGKDIVEWKIRSRGLVLARNKELVQGEDLNS